MPIRLRLAGLSLLSVLRAAATPASIPGLPQEVRILAHASRPALSAGALGKPAGYPQWSPRFARSALDSLGRRFGCLSAARLTPWDPSEGTLVLRFPKGQAARALMAAYKATGLFDQIEEDGIGFGHGAPVAAAAVGARSGAAAADPNDPYFQWQYGLKNAGTKTYGDIKSRSGADIEAVDAWAIQAGDPELKVAILDCGLDIGNPEIASRVWTNPKEIPGNGKDDDGNGFIDDVHGWSFANDAQIEGQPGTPDISDGFGHGSNVAGIVAAIGGNGIGVAGVARCTILPVKVLNANNWGYYSWWAAGLRYAVDQGARVVNMSMGGPDGNTAALKSAVAYAISKGVTIVVSMGNERSNTPQYPAAFDGVIAVGATGPDDQWVHSFPWDTTKGSNFGGYISVSAPGDYIYGLDYQNRNDFTSYWSGTSQAAPHVTGVCALLLAQDPKRTPADLKRLIEAGAEDQVGNPSLDAPGWDPYYGHGRLNAKRSLMAGAAVAIRPPRRPSAAILPYLRGYDLLGRNPSSRRALFTVHQ